MASILNKDPANYAKEKASFLRDLQHFHDTRGTPSRASPKIDGKEIDLYLLYVLVTAQGGWVKVNQRNDWKNLLENFDLISSCVNAEVALKQIYLRYLDRYEKINFLGETGSIAGDDDEDSRHRKWSARALHSVPLVYNHHQHTVNEPVRAFHGLSTNLYKASDYDKLSLSLLSPLPNEQDLAINVCILLSNENKHAIKLSKCPQILHHLLAHAGVFTHPASRKYWDDYYRKVRKWSIKSFWKEVLDEQELMYLTDENRFCARTPKTLPRKDDESSSCSDDDDDFKNNKVKLNFDPSDDELFGLKRPLGTDDPYGQRVYQVALILRNLTFFEENMKVMGQDLTFLRFVLLCCATRWNCLHQIGFEMLGNIGPVVPLDVGSLQHATLNIVCKNITESNDRSIILSAVEALNRMGSKESNEEFLLKNINQKVYDKICNMLSLHDIMLLIQTLECLYSLSSLGERACNAIVHVHGVIDTLVSLITVEAQTYGPKACILMRVIETVTTPSTTTFTPEPTPKTHLMAAPSVPPPTNVSQNLISTFTSQNVLPLPTPAVANPVILPNAPTAVPVMSTTLNTFTTVTPTVPPLVQTVATPKIIVPATMTVTTNSTLVSSNQVSTAPSVVPQPANERQENEQFALNWIRATLEVCPTPGRGIDQAELYKLYMTACARAGRRGVIAPLHFPRCVKALFGPGVGPKTVKLAQSHGGIAMDPPTQIIAYEGIQVRSKPLPFPISAPMVVSQSTSVTASSIPTSPILKAQLSAPATNAQQSSPLIKREILGKTIQCPVSSTNVSTETSVITTVASAAISQSEGTILSNSNTSLIKTLLATKVCDPKLNVPSSATIKLSNNESCTLYASSQNCNSTVITEVTQRQQQQKILQQQNNSTSLVSTSSIIIPKQVGRINGVRTTSADEVCKNDNITVIKSELQPSVITTISASNNKILVNSLNKLNDKDQNEVEPKKANLLNGTPEVSEMNDVTSKSVMLSGLLDKEIEKKDTPFLFESIQVGDNGLELNGSCIESKDKLTTGTCIKIKQESEESKLGQQLVKVIVGGKRTSEEDIPCDQAPKKPHLNGNSSSNDEENMEVDESNMKASSTAANLYAALAADVLEDIDGLEEESPKTPAVPQQIQVTTQPTTQQIFQTPGQIIVSSSNTQWASNNQRGIVTMVHQGGSGGPQYVLAQPQSALVQGQAQTVLVAQTTPQGSGAKTIIILQQPANNNQTSNTMTLSQTNFVQSSSPANQSKVIVQRIPTPPTIKQPNTVVSRPVTPAAVVTSNANKQQVKVIKTVPHVVSASMPTPSIQTRIRTTTPMKVTGELNHIQGQFLCEWRGCMRNFKSANEVYMHACESHCPSNGVQEMQCLWERCDAMKRKRFSLMTHLFDRHCNPDVLRMMAVRRRQLSQSGRSEIPPPAPPAPHPGYAPNAAFNAIKRHALEFVNPKELQDDNEGPVTKSIRLTSALILRNLVIYSSTGRWHLKRYEAHLSNIALSNVESSRTISQLLFDLCHSS
ncbi:Armadillo-type fold,DNA-binding RFX-type winged-helix domain,Armadillo-like helical,ARID DNA-binding [Cinara cedri]|uniref:Armadillo-type fold,DNA-binding RFX-type winged-helix domain,Armadillo-like helical,ARID DNA-binding n=1 Tax=Cinara cedri TaxID=506608 RepID=A0A5E4N2P1_9HEMI|nr:Armadillo-type fold,DNA-binding RFX-type winged-helix domain,Armadillo-like helical,ARID DNA-binding [Cinara cedri]